MKEIFINLIIYGFILFVAYLNIQSKRQQRKKMQEEATKTDEQTHQEKLVDSNEEIKSDYVDTLGFNNDDISQEEVHAHDGMMYLVPFTP